MFVTLTLINVFEVKVACRISIWKEKHFVKIVIILVTVLLKIKSNINEQFLHNKNQPSHTEY